MASHRRFGRRDDGYATAGAAVTISAARTLARRPSDSSGGISLYITGVTSRASSVELTSPPMMTAASGE